MPAKKKVSIFWQCLASIIIISGLYACQRINKLRRGIMIYLASIGIAVLSALFTQIHFSNSQKFTLADDVFMVFIMIMDLGTIIFPMYFIAKWSEQWNKGIDGQNSQPTTRLE